MTVVRLDDEDLDEEDRAILAEVSKKGYYHGRPKSEACAPPVRLQDEQPHNSARPVSLTAAAAAAPNQSRAQFDDFQRKWDGFGQDEYLAKLEAELVVKDRSGSQVPAREPKPTQATEFKLLLVGDGGTGKSALIRKHLTGEFEERLAPTSGVTVHPLDFFTDCGDLRFNVWDLSAGERHWRHGAVREKDYSQGQGAIVMFDVTSRRSYDNARNWHREVVRTCGAIPVVLVGNKVDVKKRQVKAKHILYHRLQKLQYYDISVRSGYNFEKPFLWLAQRLVNQPALRFVGPVAEAPLAKLDQALFEQHARKLDEAQRLAVGDSSDATT